MNELHLHKEKQNHVTLRSIVGELYSSHAVIAQTTMLVTKYSKYLRCRVCKLHIEFFIGPVHELDASVFLPNINGFVERPLIFCTY